MFDEHLCTFSARENDICLQQLYANTTSEDMQHITHTTSISNNTFIVPAFHKNKTNCVITPQNNQHL